MALVLVVALIVSLMYVPSVHAADSEYEGPGLIESVLIVGAVVWGITYWVKKSRDNAAERQANEIAQREAYIAANPGLTESVKSAIRSGNVTLGMTAEQVKMVWGNPQRVNASVGVWGINEQWVYPTRYLYFDNGVVTSWQTR